MNQLTKIVWAIDAYSQQPRIDRLAMRLMQSLSHGETVAIYPVYVMVPNRANVLAELLYPQILALEEAAQEQLAQRLKKATVPGLQAPNVLVEPIFSTTGAVKALCRHAAKLNADLIVAGTHGRSGVGRLFLGSFAETLTLHSRIPVMTVGPHTRVPSRIEHILFPTDLGERHQRDFGRILELAAELGARITVFHQIQEPLVIQPGSRAILVQEKLTKEEMAVARRRAADFAAEAQKKNISCKAILVRSNFSVSEHVLRVAARQRVDLIAMAARSGRISAPVLGSVTRQVMRASTRPVWVLHEKAISGVASMQKRNAA